MTKASDTIDALFAQAKDQTPPVPDALMARMLADAAAMQPRPASDVRPVVAPASGGLFGPIWAALGGWAGAGSLAAAAAAGVWIGIAPPTTGLAGLTDAVFGASITLDVLSSDDILGLEG